MQERLTSRLASLVEAELGARDVARLAMAAVGRSGRGDAGQRVRDEILAIQQKNAAKARPRSLCIYAYIALINMSSPRDQQVVGAGALCRAA